MTPTQRKFKKQIEELEREGKIPDSYRARRERNITFKSRTSIITILILIWNCFVIFTWVIPFINKSKYTKPIIPNNTIISSSNTNIKTNLNDNEIVIYLERCREASIKINEIITKITNHNINGIKYRSEDIVIDISELSTIKEELKTDEVILKDLKETYTEIIGVIEETIVDINNQKVDTYKRYNELNPQIREEIIKVLERQNMKYEILENGELKYYYTY